MSDIGVFRVALPIRCCELIESRALLTCSKPALWERPGPGFNRSTFYCNAHRRPIDFANDENVIVRRVCVTSQFTLTAVHVVDRLAEAEAIERINQAVQGVGGAFSPVNAMVLTGQYVPWPSMPA